MIEKLLIANRGEIALRIIRSCQRLGIRTVAVFSDADRGHPFTEAADERVALGGTHATDSYLDQEKIITAALQTGAKAIHPGYGFLAENAEFCRAVRKAKLVFVGPSPETMELLGDKQRARTLAKKLGVPLPRGYEGKDQSEEHFVAAAEEIGYPLMVKAAGAGGGRGMRCVRSESELRQSLEIVRREAQTFFQDSQLILEQLVEPARHIEVQLLGDSSGQILHFFDRDCSAQRRFQKIVEIAPAEGLPEKLRAELYEAAVALAREAKLVAAATAEFLVSPEDFSFYFLEVNPRLQVEHPVTELLTGVDLVELQIRAAIGESIQITQESIQQRGAAVEVRVCAEMPELQFAPSSGTIRQLILPEAPDIRVDHGIAQGITLSTAYDSLIAKITAYSDNHQKARSRLSEALQSTAILGVPTNLGFLIRILEQPFPVSTSFVEQHLEELTSQRFVEAHAKEAFAWHLQAECQHMHYTGNPFYLHSTYGRHSASSVNTAPVIQYQVHSEFLPAPLVLEARPIETGEQEPAGLSSHSLTYDPYGQAVSRLMICGYEFLVERRAPGASDAVDAAELNASSRAPLPGTIARIAVQPGDILEQGSLLLVIESMKMEHSVLAPREGVVEHIHVQEGDVVEKNKELISFKG